MSLHRILSLFVLVLAALALAGAVSVVLLTTHLHQTTVGLETGLQSVRLAEEMQVDLLQYIGTHNEFLRTRMESDLRQKLHLARQYVNAPEEEALLAEAAQLIEKHVAKMQQSPDADDNDGDLDLAFKALRGFVDINVEQADAAMRESERWDNLGDRIGVVFSAGLIIGIILILMWLKRVAFQPVFEIRQAIRDFAAGRKDTRAPEHGPEELRTIAKQFNEMANALARQYENQLAFLAAVAHDLRNPIG